MGGKPFNIYDVASAAGVSTATVSRVIRRHGSVSPATRKRVLDVVETLGYTPNAFAQGLGHGSMNVVGVMCTDVSDIFYAGCVSTIERLLREMGLASLLCCTGSDISGKREALNILQGKGVDAVILVGSPFADFVDDSCIEAVARKIPIICVNCFIEGQNIYCALCDENQGMYDNAALMMKSGCRRILYLYDAMTYSGRQKLDGYRRAHADAGITHDESLIIRVPRDPDIVAARAGAVLDEARDIDGVLASEDLLAVCALKALETRGISLPIIGFNDSVLARCTTPTLTSTDNKADTMCGIAVSTLGDVLEGRSPPNKVVIPAHLVLRETFRIN